MAIYGRLIAWPPATEALATYPDEASILIGVGYEYRGGSTDVHRSYLMISRDPFKTSVLDIRQHNGLAPTVSRSEGGLVGLVSGLVVALIGTWYFWLRRTRANVT